MQAMTEQDRPTPGFATSEGLRAVLNRLDGAGPGAWSADPEARELVLFAARDVKLCGVVRPVCLRLGLWAG